MSINSSNNTEADILKSATKLFMEKGFSGTSTTEIAKDAGCNQALVHYYFRSKNKLFDAVFESKFNLFLSKFLEIEQSELSFEQKIAQFVRSHFSILQENPKLPHLLFTELNSNPTRLEELKEKMKMLPKDAIRQLDAQLQMEIRFGNIRPMSVFELILTIVSLNAGVFLVKPMFQIISGFEEKQYEELMTKRKEEHVQLVLSSIRPINVESEKRP